MTGWYPHVRGHRTMHHMLQPDEPKDYVVATGEDHSVREFCELAFAHAGLDYRDHVVVSEKFGIRITDVVSPAERIKKLR